MGCQLDKVHDVREDDRGCLALFGAGSLVVRRERLAHGSNRRVDSRVAEGGALGFEQSNCVYEFVTPIHGGLFVEVRGGEFRKRTEL